MARFGWLAAGDASDAAGAREHPLAAIIMAASHEAHRFMTKV
jgi:hypothetical protein